MPRSCAACSAAAIARAISRARACGERAGRQLFAQRPAFEVFRRDEDLIADLFEREHRGDRRMRQRRGGARFLAQPRPHPIVAKQVRRQRLQRDRAMQPRVVREIHHAHAAAADNALDAIGADLGARLEQRRRFEKAVAVVVRFEQRQHFILDVRGLGRRAHQRKRAQAGGAASARSNNAPTRCQRSAFASLRRDRSLIEREVPS